MKATIFFPTIMALIILLTSEPTSAAECPATSFAATGMFSAGDQPVSVAVGDFNGDGKPDLAVANQFSADVSILLGNGDGTFGLAVNYPAGSAPSSLAVGDFNG